MYCTYSTTTVANYVWRGCYSTVRCNKLVVTLAWNFVCCAQLGQLLDVQEVSVAHEIQFSSFASPSKTHLGYSTVHSRRRGLSLSHGGSPYLRYSQSTYWSSACQYTAAERLGKKLGRWYSIIVSCHVAGELGKNSNFCLKPRASTKIAAIDFIRAVLVQVYWFDAFCTLFDNEPLL